MEDRKRSKNYPGASLADSVSHLRSVHAKLGLGVHQREDISGAIGAPTLTGSSARKIAAMAAFGLLDKSARGYAISPLGKQILRPLEGEQEGLYRQAFYSVDLYREVFDAFADEERLPEGLPIILERKFGIADGVGEYACRILRESAISANLIGADGSFIGRTGEVKTEKDVAGHYSEAGVVQQRPQTGHGQGVPAADWLVIELPKPPARFQCPRALTEKEKERVVKWINEVLLKQFDFLVEDDE